MRCAKILNFDITHGRLRQKLDKLCAGTLCVDFLNDMGYSVVGIGNESGADGAHVFPPCHFLFLPHTERLVNLGRFVAEEQERKGILAGKFHMACSGILADAYNNVAHPGEAGIIIPYQIGRAHV